MSVFNPRTAVWGGGGGKLLRSMTYVYKLRIYVCVYKLLRYMAYVIVL